MSEIQLHPSLLLPCHTRDTLPPPMLNLCGPSHPSTLPSSRIATVCYTSRRCGQKSLTVLTLLPQSHNENSHSTPRLATCWGVYFSVCFCHDLKGHFFFRLDKHVYRATIALHVYVSHSCRPQTGFLHPKCRSIDSIAPTLTWQAHCISAVLLQVLSIRVSHHSSAVQTQR